MCLVYHPLFFHIPKYALLTTLYGRTQGGIFTTPGDAYTTPVEMWLKAFGASELRGSIY